MFLCVWLVFTFGFGVSICGSNAYNTTAVAANIESTIGSPGILVDPTIISTGNTTVEQYEVSVLYGKFSNIWKNRKVYSPNQLNKYFLNLSRMFSDES